MCGSMADIQSAAAEIRRGKKRRKKEERTNHSMKIFWSALLHRATIESRRLEVEPPVSVAVRPPEVAKMSWRPKNLGHRYLEIQATYSSDYY